MHNSCLLHGQPNQGKKILSIAGFFFSHFIISGTLAHGMVHPHLEWVFLPLLIILTGLLRSRKGLWLLLGFSVLLGFILIFDFWLLLVRLIRFVLHLAFHIGCHMKTELS